MDSDDAPWGVVTRYRAIAVGQFGPERELTALSSDLGEEDIAALAYELWQARGCPDGSPDEDWYQAVETLRSRT